MEEISFISEQLSSRLRKQRDKFLNHIIDLFTQVPSLEKYKPSINNTYNVIGAFQVVHVLSFVSAKNYIPQESIGKFTKLVCKDILDSNFDVSRKYIQRYTTLKNKKIEEQMQIFMEDTTMAILNSSVGMIYGPALTLAAFEFLYRNWGITADIFNDKEETIKMAKAVKNMHEKYENNF